MSFWQNIQRTFDCFVCVYYRWLKFQLVVCNPGDVEEVIDQMCFQFDVATDDLNGVVNLWRPVGALLKLGDHHDDGRKGIAQFVGEQSEELIFRSIRRDQFLSHRNIRRLVLDEEQNALDFASQILEPNEVESKETRFASGRQCLPLLDVKRDARSGHLRAHFLNAQIKIMDANISRVLAASQPPEFAHHFQPALVVLYDEKSFGIDDCNPHGHVRQNFLVEQGLPRDALVGGELISVEPADEPGGDACADYQPCRENGSFGHQVVDRPVGNLDGLGQTRNPLRPLNSVRGKKPLTKLKMSLCL